MITTAERGIQRHATVVREGDSGGGVGLGWRIGVGRPARRRCGGGVGLGGNRSWGGGLLEDGIVA